MLQFIARSKENKDNVVRGTYKTNDPKEVLRKFKEHLVQKVNEGTATYGEQFRIALTRADYVIDEWTVVAKPPKGSHLKIVPLLDRREERKVIIRKRLS